MEYREPSRTQVPEYGLREDLFCKVNYIPDFDSAVIESTPFSRAGSRFIRKNLCGFIIITKSGLGLPKWHIAFQKSFNSIWPAPDC